MVFHGSEIGLDIEGTTSCSGGGNAITADFTSFESARNGNILQELYIISLLLQDLSTNTTKSTGT